MSMKIKTIFVVRITTDVCETETYYCEGYDAINSLVFDIFTDFDPQFYTVEDVDLHLRENDAGKVEIEEVKLLSALAKPYGVVYYGEDYMNRVKSEKVEADFDTLEEMREYIREIDYAHLDEGYFRFKIEVRVPKGVEYDEDEDLARYW